jgi:hypothetical protein
MLVDDLLRVLNGQGDTVDPRMRAALTCSDGIRTLIAERERMTAHIDAQIVREVERLARITSGVPIPPQTATGTSAVESKLRDGNKQERVVAYLREHPGATYRVLASAVYGDDESATLNRVRSCVYYLRKTKRLHPSKMEVNAEK